MLFYFMLRKRRHEGNIPGGKSGIMGKDACLQVGLRRGCNTSELEKNVCDDFRLKMYFDFE
jgi:hypothetical protein